MSNVSPLSPLYTTGMRFLKRSNTRHVRIILAGAERNLGSLGAPVRVLIPTDDRNDYCTSLQPSRLIASEELVVNCW